VNEGAVLGSGGPVLALDLDAVSDTAPGLTGLVFTALSGIALAGVLALLFVAPWRSQRPAPARQAPLLRSALAPSVPRTNPRSTETMFVYLVDSSPEASLLEQRLEEWQKAIEDSGLAAGKVRRVVLVGDFGGVPAAYAQNASPADIRVIDLRRPLTSP